MLCEYGSVYMLFGGLSVCGLSVYVCACAPVWVRACLRVLASSCVFVRFCLCHCVYNNNNNR